MCPLSTDKVHKSPMYYDRGAFLTKTKRPKGADMNFKLSRLNKLLR